MSKEFIIRSYGKSELANIYIPNAPSSRSAWKVFKHWIGCHAALSGAMQHAGYDSKCSRNFTPRQVELIVKYLGEP